MRDWFRLAKSRRGNDRINSIAGCHLRTITGISKEPGAGRKSRIRRERAQFAGVIDEPIHVFRVAARNEVERALGFATPDDGWSFVIRHSSFAAYKST